jgi:hypothetical protein
MSCETRSAWCDNVKENRHSVLVVFSNGCNSTHTLDLRSRTGCEGKVITLRIPTGKAKGKDLITAGPLLL